MTFHVFVALQIQMAGGQDGVSVFLMDQNGVFEIEEDGIAKVHVIGW